MNRTVVTRDICGGPQQTPEEFRQWTVAYVRMVAESLHEHGRGELTRDMARALVSILNEAAPQSAPASPRSTSRAEG